RSYFTAFPFETIVVQNGIIKHGAIEIVASDMWHALRAELEEGTWSGFIGYEMGFYAEKKLKPLLKDVPQSPINTHDLYLQRSCLEIIYDHKAKTLQVAIDRVHEKMLASAERFLCENITETVLQKLLIDPRTLSQKIGPFAVAKPFEPFELFA